MIKIKKIELELLKIKIFVLKEKPKGCSDGFFNPDDEEDKSTCYPCKSYCKKCKGKADNPICTKCNNGFEPEYNDKNEIIKCNLKSSELNENFVCGDECLECDQKEKMCLKCKTGYFIPDDSNDNYYVKIIMSPNQKIILLNFVNLQKMKIAKQEKGKNA